MRIYFLGIAGTAMGNAALLLRDQGHEIIGADQAVYPPMSVMLDQAGVEVLEGYDANRLAELTPDLVVIGNAFSRGNAEVEFLLDQRSLPYCSLPEALKRFALFNRNNIVVTGTHGKTTTTSLAAHLLLCAGRSPGYLIGGAPIDPPSGWSSGNAADPFVIEGDEYDSAFFDKRSKFIHYAPNIVILNNLEFDHADIFRDLCDVKRTFSHLMRIIPSSGFLLVNGDDTNAMSLLPAPWTQVLSVGVGADCALRIENYETQADGSSFELHWQGELWAKVKWDLIGLFNARNAAMAGLAAALSTVGKAMVLQFPLDGLKRFRGVRRRQTILVDTPGLKVIEDFGHHPTAIGETLEAMRKRFSDTRQIAAFEPRTNTSRLEIMRQPMLKALSKADEVVIGAAKAGGGQGADLLDTSAMADELSRAGTPAIACKSNDDALVALEAMISEPVDQPTLVIFFTNGSFGGIIDRFANRVSVS